MDSQPADWVQSATPIPGRTTYSFNPPNVFPSQQQSSTLTIRTDASTLPNTYNLTIGGTTINGPSGVRSMPTSLTVTPSTTPPNTPSISTVSSFSAQVGQTVTLTGNNLGNATQVWFGGVPAAFTANVSTNAVTAAVPPNAPTAPISVVTASGTAQTAQNFVPVQVAAATGQAQFNLGIVFWQAYDIARPGLIQVSNAVAGFGSGVTGGLTDYARGLLNNATGVNGVVDTSSNLYRGGEVVGIATSLALDVGEVVQAYRAAKGASTTVELFNTGVRGRPMDSLKFKKLKAAFERTGGVIDQSADAVAYLDFRNGNALTLNSKTILLRPDPSASEVFEEFIHTAQFRKGTIDSSEVMQAEIEAAEKLIRYRRLYGITNDETRFIIQRLKNFRRLL
ncbi:IPT/TIG domain-containing protein [Anthocerotibacter panamensis]|uniref:IPT/TIG domain-containing protein n=1 Tax=Anthocerotibacter panamensis TaxID=2857077 RepID=UPI001C401E46|nr:IPT/TIG domain-containing protein [Anthocerotibacter panamensis]